MPNTQIAMKCFIFGTAHDFMDESHITKTVNLSIENGNSRRLLTAVLYDPKGPPKIGHRIRAQCHRDDPAGVLRIIIHEGLHGTLSAALPRNRTSTSVTYHSRRKRRRP